MELQAPVNKNLFLPAEADGLGLETLPASLEEAVEVAQNSEFLHSVFCPRSWAAATTPRLCAGARR